MARRRVRRWLDEGTPSTYWAERWAQVLAGTAEEVIAVITDPREDARALRQSTPFAGAIDPRTRWEILRRHRSPTERT